MVILLTLFLRHSTFAWFRLVQALFYHLKLVKYHVYSASSIMAVLLIEGFVGGQNGTFISFVCQMVGTKIDKMIKQCMEQRQRQGTSGQPSDAETQLQNLSEVP